MNMYVCLRPAGSLASCFLPLPSAPAAALPGGASAAVAAAAAAAWGGG
eukprot:CAMPEP_0197557892 /NCGR_PEP_ID=MMETSP1320-20131121/17955_1 /TAXON_ID=91990 /ORGANISM="Bolidomonas sp., Strain RCC2347" /LENGTH=47 /DNA_ID= /DNA_START= /DNA_END= /DNA_ORIENTATION=